MKKILYPLSVVYNFISKLNDKFTKREQLNIPVISVGNITWGGSGKTPVVLKIAEYVLSKNKTPVILSRGYGRKNNTQGSVIVRDKEKILSGIAEAGDEPYMMSQRIKCPVIVGKNRIKSADLAHKFNPDVFILDDGFQHWKLKRDLDVVCINSLNPFGNNMIIPAGILREDVTSLKRAGIIILTNTNLCDEKKLQEIKKRIINITGRDPLLSFCSGFNLTSMSGSNETDMSFLHRKKIVVLCAIGSPDNFKSTIENLGVHITGEIVFKDHHKYDLRDIKKIASAVQEENCIILTTHKDAVKLEDIADAALKRKIYFLNISVSFKEGKVRLEKSIDKILNEEL